MYSGLYNITTRAIRQGAASNVVLKYALFIYLFLYIVHLLDEVSNSATRLNLCLLLCASVADGFEQHFTLKTEIESRRGSVLLSNSIQLTGSICYFSFSDVETMSVLIHGKPGCIEP